MEPQGQYGGTADPRHYSAYTESRNPPNIFQPDVLPLTLMHNLLHVTISFCKMPWLDGRDLVTTWRILFIHGDQQVWRECAYGCIIKGMLEHGPQSVQVFLLGLA